MENNKICVIIPDRNDRPEFTDHCLMQIERQTKQPDKVYHINYPPTSKDVDIVPRVRKGISLAKQDNCTHAYIFENDDYYPDAYIELMPFNGAAMIGISISCYYSLPTSGYSLILHPFRSSLYCTAFEIKALDKFIWPDDDVIFLDMSLWEYAIESIDYKLYELNYPRMPVGIKHGIGKCGGAWHGKIFDKCGCGAVNDKGRAWLTQITRPESMKLYNKINGT